MTSTDFAMVIMAASSGLCALSCILCVAAVIYVAARMTRKEHKPYYALVTIQNGEWCSKVRPMLREEWHVIGITPGSMVGWTDVHLERWV